MATVYIAEYVQTLSEFLRGGSAAQSPTIAEQTVAIGVGPASSNPFTTQTQLIRVHCDAACSIVIGNGLTATASNSRLASNQTEYYGVSPGMTLSVIENT